MKRDGTLWILALTLLALFLVPSQAQAQNPIYRIAATYRFFGSERSTTLPPFPAAVGGAALYSKTLVIPPGVNVLYVTMSTTGDTHSGARSQFACRTAVPGGAFAPCQAGPGDPSGAAPTGWISLSRHRDYNRDYTPRPGVVPFGGDGAGGAGDLHDNSIHYQWCVKVPFSEVPLSRTVQLRMASRGDPVTVSPAPLVFIEGLHVYVDASLIPTASLRCAQDTATLPTGRISEPEVTRQDEP